MMSANEFFDIGPEPAWLVDACGGEVISPTLDVDIVYGAASSSSSAYLDLNHENEAGPSSPVMDMELDNESRPDVPFVSNTHQELQRSGTHLYRNEGAGLIVERSPTPVVSEQHNPWLSAIAPIRASKHILANPPSADFFLRACKKRKRAYA